MSVTFVREGTSAPNPLTLGFWRDDPDAVPVVNVNHGNATFLLDLLGLGPDPWGELDGEDFLGRVMVALALYGHDPGKDSVELQHGEEILDPFLAHLVGDVVREDGPRVVIGGRPEGYAEERLEELAEVARDAIAHNVKVTWA